MRIIDTALRLLGATSGEQILKTAAAASGQITLPAGTTDFSATGGTAQVVKQTTAGGAFTVAQVAATDLSNVTAARLLGNPTGSAAAPSEISLGTNLSFAGTVLNAAGGASGLSGMTAGQIPIAATATTVTSSANLSGDVVSTATTLATTIQANAVTTTKINNSAVTYAKIQNVANNRVLGNTSGSAAAPSEITLPLIVANGGTGAATLPLPSNTPTSAGSIGAILLGSGTTAVASDATWGSFGAGTFGGYTASATQGPVFSMGRALGTPAAAAAVTAGTQLFSLDSEGYGTTWATGAAINAYASETWSGSAHGAYWEITTITPTTTTIVTRMKIGPGVQVGAPTGGDKGAGTLNATSVYANNTLLTSDERLKQDIEPVLEGCIQLVDAIAPKTFRFIPREDGPRERRNWGFTAQDIQAVLPDAVEEDAEGNLSYSPSDLTAVLWRAVQELSARVAELEARGASGG